MLSFILKLSTFELGQPQTTGATSLASYPDKQSKNF